MARLQLSSFVSLFPLLAWAIHLPNLVSSEAYKETKTAIEGSPANNSSSTYIFESVANGSERYENVTRIECAVKCSQWALTRSCRSFSFAPTDGFTNMMAALGSCEVLYGSQWLNNQSWRVTDPLRQFYVDQNVQEIRSTFKIILSKNGGSIATDMVWNTDCMNQGTGISGILVAIRNNLTTSAYLTDLKCRIFERGVSLVQFPAITIHHNQFPGYDMTCPAGSVLTAVYDIEMNLPNPNSVRCNTLVSPWQVDPTNCRNITTLKPTAWTLPLSPMNDPTLSGTADSLWGAQCGTTQVMEASMVAYKLAQDPNQGVEKITCCLLVQRF